MENCTLILKSFSDYQTHVQGPGGEVTSQYKKRVVLGRFNIAGVDVHVPYPVFEYPGNMLATPHVHSFGSRLATDFTKWRIFDVVHNRYLPITVHSSHPGVEAIVTLVNRYVDHARGLDDSQLIAWARTAAAQLGVSV